MRDSTKKKLALRRKLGTKETEKVVIDIDDDDDQVASDAYFAEFDEAPTDEEVGDAN